MEIEDCKIGQELVVELENEILIGELRLISKDKRLIELINVRDFNRGYKFTSSQCIPRPLIKSIRQCKPESLGSPTSSPDDELSNPPTEFVVPITSDELDNIQTIVSSATYIFQGDQKYHKAIEQIKLHNFIGLQVEPSRYGRHNRTSLIIITTFQSVYIFDIVSLGAVFKDLKNILQAKSPRKVLYQSNEAADSLKYNHGIELGGVFDIFVAHCLISKQKDFISFEECVANYLNIPINYFQEEDKTKLNIYNRPLPKSLLDIMSKKAVFLLKLHDHIVHEMMLKKFYNQCEEYSTSLSKTECKVEVVKQMAKDERGTHCIRNEDWADLLENTLKL